MTGAKLTQAEIARQAADRSHLEPDPVICLAHGYRCTVCGEERDAIIEGLGVAGLQEWLARHRRVCGPLQAIATAKAPVGLQAGEESSRGGLRVLGAKDSKDGGEA